MKIKGFTLIEVLITLIFLAGLFLLSITSVSFLRYKNERQTIIDEIRTAIQYAKIQATILGHPVYLAPVDTSLNWSQGMTLTQYNNKKNTSNLLYQWHWNHPRWNITWSGVGALNKITLSNNPVSAISNGQFLLFNSYTKEHVAIILNKLGRVKIRLKD